MKFFSAKNLLQHEVSESAPWDFYPSEQELAFARSHKKEARRAWLSKPATVWCCWSPVRGLNPGLRVCKENPPVAVRGAAADFDAKTELDAVMQAIGDMPLDWQPNLIETSLGNKVRLVWKFERELLMPSTEFCEEFFRVFFDKLRVPVLLAGYDAASGKPTTLWSNGGRWHDTAKEAPMSAATCFGILAEVAKKSSLFGPEQVPLTVIAKEVEKRFSGRWIGEFKESATGVRFWDAAADCPTGCQVKPDGMLCFTGRVPFMSWADIFGRDFVESERSLQLGKAADNIYFDDKNYFHKVSEKWVTRSRQDTLLTLVNRGLSNKVPKGAIISDADRVLAHIQESNRIDGAAPLINYPPGMVSLRDGRVLNTLRLLPVLPASTAKGEITEFPWIYKYLDTLLARPENGATDYLLSWMQRFYKAILGHKRMMGQTLFLAGPAQSGKTLLSIRILAPLFGGRIANPHSYMMGETDFTDDLFEAALWLLNDETSPRNEAAKQSFQAKLKSFVVNPSHTYHPKFCKKVTIDWTGRIFITLNDDPQSVGILPECNDNTRDKMCFFASQPYHAGQFPGNVEEIIERELPFFAHWLLNVYTPPAFVLSGDRCGVTSYYDPTILNLSQQQHASYNLVELLSIWIDDAIFWTDPEAAEWQGTPSDLLSTLSTTESTVAIVKEWTVVRLAKSMTALARNPASGVEFVGSGERNFRIVRKVIKRK